jgi:hypothetical protein
MKMNISGIEVSDHTRVCIRANMGLKGQATRAEIRGLLEEAIKQVFDEQTETGSKVDPSTLKYKSSDEKEDES